MYKFVYGDIFTQNTNVIVMPANPKPVIGNGIDKEIYKRAGAEELLKARQEIGELKYGEVKVTPAFNYDANYIFHCASPKWIDGKHDEKELLAKCYRDSIELAKQMGSRIIFFPLLSSGMQGFQYDLAKDIAEEVCKDYEEDNSIDIRIFLRKRLSSGNRYDRKSLEFYIETHTYPDNIEEIYKQYLSFMKNMPEDHEISMNAEIMRLQVENKRKEQEQINAVKKKAEKRKNSSAVDYIVYQYCRMQYKSLSDFSFNETDDEFPSFEDLYEKYKERCNLKNDSKVAERCNLNRDTISRAKKATRGISRDTLFALSLGLRLSWEEAEEFFISCDKAIYTDYQLTEAEKRRENVFRFCLKRGVYDIAEINEYLFDSNMLILGNNAVA
ncbi:macro domain-containing protein [Pseudobutyrivibrio sp. LB2011]|uniref:macro domain-containing protein n=1 Tax=Pseudobutyrivibrio sp. LB2011 TaxID=1408312 RepID=UPI0005D17C6C|nr:macro domain-containing protein [Pseudobutyrivibrio sp. LB2011]